MIVNHVMHKSLFGEQELQKLIQESRNQAEIPEMPEMPEMPESRSENPRVADPLCLWHSLHYGVH